MCVLHVSVHQTNRWAPVLQKFKKEAHLKHAIFCEWDLTNLWWFIKISNMSHVRVLIQNPIFCCVVLYSDPKEYADSCKISSICSDLFCFCLLFLSCSCFVHVIPQAILLLESICVFYVVAFLGFFLFFLCFGWVCIIYFLPMCLMQILSIYTHRCACMILLVRQVNESCSTHFVI